MSYQNQVITITKGFFESHSKVVTAIPPEEVPSGGGRVNAPRAKLTKREQQLSRCIFFTDINRFINARLKQIIADNDLLAFAYSYNCMNISEHVRVIITKLSSVELKWYHESNWAYLSISKPSPNSYLGMIEFSSSGTYQAFCYGDHPIGIPNSDNPKDDTVCFDSSHFMLDEKDVKVCGFNRAKCQRVEIPNAEFQIIDDRGLNLLADELQAHLEKTNKLRSPLEGLEGLDLFVTPLSHITVTREMLENSGGCINILPDYERAKSDSYPKGWPVARIIEDISPFVTPEFMDYLGGDSEKPYLTFAIDNGTHSSISTNIPPITVVISPDDAASIGISVDYRAMAPLANSNLGEIRFYSCPLMGYSVYFKGKPLGHGFSGSYDPAEHGVIVNDSNGFSLLECEMRRGNL